MCWRYSNCKRNWGAFKVCSSYHLDGNHGLNSVSFINFNVAEQPSSLMTFLIFLVNSDSALIARVKERLNRFRHNLSVVCEFPRMQCLNSFTVVAFTTPFPSHRTFSFPEYGGPIVFVLNLAQFPSIFDSATTNVD